MSSRRAATRTIHPPEFLNVDLEIESATQPDALLAEWGERVFVMYSGPGRLDAGPALRSRRWLLTLETCRPYRTPDAVIHAFCKLVEDLPPTVRRLWDQARKRFDAGYELRPAATWTHAVLRADTLERITKVGAELAVSVYRGRRKNV